MVFKKLNKENLSADILSAVFEAENIPFHAISSVNWKEYPYQPDVKFGIAHDESRILLNYKVNESDIKAVCDSDNGRVWEDSCVEFFISIQDNFYYNIECNCIAKLLLATGAGRSNRIPAPEHVIRKIDRWSSLGNQPIENQSGDWEVSLIIPKEVFYLDNIKTLSGLRCKGNFYKCGDKLKTPHFLSWNPIKSETPDFHLPAFFDEMLFDIS